MSYIEIKLISRKFCDDINCSFRSRGDFIRPDGTKINAFLCKRKDCDNWIVTERKEEKI